MRIVIKAKPNSKKESVERVVQPTLGLTDIKNELVEYKVCVKAPPVGGKANEAIMKLLANYFDVAHSTVKMISGKTSKRKVFEVPDI